MVNGFKHHSKEMDIQLKGAQSLMIKIFTNQIDVEQNDKKDGTIL